MSGSDRISRGINRQIEEAQEKGAFDNLPGKGKRLNLDSNPFADPEKELAYRLLQDNNFVLPWIEKGQDIDRELAIIRKMLSDTWTLVRDLRSEEKWAQDEWARAESVFRTRLEQLNNKIRDYNLEIPNLRFERFILSADSEIDKIRRQ